MRWAHHARRVSAVAASHEHVPLAAVRQRAAKGEVKKQSEKNHISTTSIAYHPSTMSEEAFVELATMQNRTAVWLS